MGWVWETTRRVLALIELKPIRANFNNLFRRVFSRHFGNLQGWLGMQYCASRPAGATGFGPPYLAILDAWTPRSPVFVEEK